MAMQLDWKSKLQVFHSYSSVPKVVEHQIGLSDLHEMGPQV